MSRAFDVPAPHREGLLAHRILLVAGKGGVGKTTTAAALAVHAAESGLRCLVVSTDPAHSLADALDRTVGPKPRKMHGTLWALEVDADTLAADYVDDVLQNLREYVSPELYPALQRQMDSARHAPGTAEAAMMEFMAGLLSQADERYDLIIFDTAPSGTTLRLLRLPEQMAQWVGSLLHERARNARMAAADGLDPALTADRDRRIAERLHQRQRRLALLRQRLLDPAHTAAVPVLVPQRLALLESQRLVDGLRDCGIGIGGIVVNQCFPEHADGAFAAARRQSEAPALTAIDGHFAQWPRARVPLQTGDVIGRDALRALAAYLRPLTDGDAYRRH